MNDFGFTVGQSITIVDPDIRGRVQAILFNTDGIQIQICYWDDNIRRVEWVFPSEITATKKVSV